MNTATLPAPVRVAPFEIRPFEGPLGAEVLGLDLTKPLTEADFTRLRRAQLEHHLLVFREQRITPSQQAAFSRRWGPLQQHVLKQFALYGHPEVLIVSNIVEGGEPIGLGDAGVFWHSDLSYKPRPSLGSLLHAQELPASGGDTLFANQHLAWSTLPLALKGAVAGRRAEHSYLKQYEELRRRNPWRPPLSNEQLGQLAPVWHPIVRTHDVSRLRALFVSEHFTTRVEGLPPDESQVLLDELFRHSTQERFVHRHVWQPHDLVFWDNRSLLHLAAGCPDHMRRKLYRTTIEGDVPV